MFSVLTESRKTTDYYGWISLSLSITQTTPYGRSTNPTSFLASPVGLRGHRSDLQQKSFMLLEATTPRTMRPPYTTRPLQSIQMKWESCGRSISIRSYGQRRNQEVRRRV